MREAALRALLSQANCADLQSALSDQLLAKPQLCAATLAVYQLLLAEVQALALPQVGAAGI